MILYVQRVVFFEHQNLDIVFVCVSFHLSITFYHFCIYRTHSCVQKNIVDVQINILKIGSIENRKRERFNIQPIQYDQKAPICLFHPYIKTSLSLSLTHTYYNIN